MYVCMYSRLMHIYIHPSTIIILTIKIINNIKAKFNNYVDVYVDEYSRQNYGMDTRSRVFRYIRAICPLI